MRLSSSGSLELLHVKAKDAGTYTCVASSSTGKDAVSIILHVHNKNIHILHKGIATNFITVTWNGTDSTVLSSDYLILYRKSDSDQDYGKVHLRPYMRTYTITNLHPNTMYEFCIAYDHMRTVYKLHCINIRTKHYMTEKHGIHTFSSSSVFLALAVVVSFTALICVGGHFIKRYIRRKPYKEPDGHIITETPGANPTSVHGERMVNKMSHIPLDNLYDPPSTDLSTSLSRTTLRSSTSKTSLISSNSKA